VPASGWRRRGSRSTTAQREQFHVAAAPDGSAVVMWMMTDGLPAMTTRRTLWVGRYLQ
jgi:hypothetical protein